MFKLVVICSCVIAIANAGIISSGLIGTTGPATIALQPSGSAAIALQHATVAVPSVSSSSSNIIRGIGNLGAISASSNSVDTAFSSERTADVRINNPDLRTGVLSYAATAPAFAGPLAVAAAGPALTLTGPALATSSLGLGINHGINGVAVNGYGLGTVNGYGLGVNGYGLQTVNGLGLGLGAVKVL